MYIEKQVLIACMMVTTVLPIFSWLEFKITPLLCLHLGSPVAVLTFSRSLLSLLDVSINP